MAQEYVTGGERLQAYLARLQQSLAADGPGPTLSVGFLEGRTYPDGTSVAAVAALQEFGGVVTIPPHAGVIHRLASATFSELLRGGRFVKARKSNFVTDVQYGGHTIAIPPRPFFRNMLQRYAGGWATVMADLLRDTEYSAARALDLMGRVIVGQLRQSIRDTNDPPNAPSTIRRKGHSKPLVDSGEMLASPDFEVSNT